jgi:DNA-binding transcriptional MerR regulator
MLIGEIAKKTKLSRHTIRFYEKMGLIEIPGKSRRDNNYKEYTEETLRQIEAIQQIKQQGFTLKEAKGILYLLKTNTLDVERGRKYISHKIRLVERQIEQLNRVKGSLLEAFESCGSPDCDVVKILNGKTVMS